LLLKRGEFPLSRPEMVEQLRAANPSLANLLTRFMTGDQDRRTIQQGLNYVKKLLVQLDRAWYSQDASERRRVAKLKGSRARPTQSASS
jgi:hypothetical protein